MAAGASRALATLLSPATAVIRRVHLHARREREMVSMYRQAKERGAAWQHGGAPIRINLPRRVHTTHLNTAEIVHLVQHRESREKGILIFSSSRERTDVSRRWTRKTAPKSDVCTVVEAVVSLRVRISKHFSGSWGRVLPLLDVTAPTQTAVHVKERPQASKIRTPKPRSRTRLRIPPSPMFQVPVFLAYPLRPRIACGTHLQANKVVLVHDCVRALKHKSPVHLHPLGKIVRSTAGPRSSR